MKPEIRLLGLPFDAKSSFLRGPADAPAAIRQILHNGASSYLAENGVDIVEDAQLRDVGDLHIKDYGDIASELKSKFGIQYKKTVFLGGDHSVTYPIIKYLTGVVNGPFDILHFDAHSDLYHEYDGDIYSHACPFARIMEDKLVSGLIQVGIRTVSVHQKSQANRFGVEIITMRELAKWDFLSFDRPVYISLDMDVFDPGVAPGVSHHEPGGVSPRQVIEWINSLKVPLIGADIVELNPRRDFHDMTTALAVKMLKEIIGKMVFIMVKSNLRGL